VADRTSAETPAVTGGIKNFNMFSLPLGFLV